MAFPVHAIRLMAMQYRPVPRLRASKRASTSDDEARIVREERESYEDDLFVDKLVVERITRTLKAKNKCGPRIPQNLVVHDRMRFP